MRQSVRSTRDFVTMKNYGVRLLVWSGGAKGSWSLWDAVWYKDVANCGQFYQCTFAWPRRTSPTGPSKRWSHRSFFSRLFEGPPPAQPQSFEQRGNTISRRTMNIIEAMIFVNNLMGRPDKTDSMGADCNDVSVWANPAKEIKGRRVVILLREAKHPSNQQG